MKNNNNIYYEWITKADNDYETAAILFREEGPTDTLCFHCQQSVEKYLKAYLTYHKVHFEKVHNLVVLVKLCAKIDPNILEFIDKLKILDAYYIESRYPPSLVNYSKKECQDALNISKKIIGYINNKLSEKNRGC